jgi:hypothetical protein
VFTPHEAIRRIADHLVDHLAQIEALLAGAEPIPDTWHGRTITLGTDWAPFTEADLNEARNRLGRLGHVYALRLRSLDDQALDARGQVWAIRQIVEHVAGVTWYAEQVERLGAPGAEVRSAPSWSPEGSETTTQPMPVAPGIAKGPCQGNGLTSSRQ